MALLDVLKDPHYILRIKAAEITKVDDDIRSFMNDMLYTMYHENGIGLAAPQVGHSKRILVVDLQGVTLNSSGRIKSGKKKIFEPLFVANPCIIEHSSNLLVMNEGCLSVPNEEVAVSRFESIKVEYLDYNNNLVIQDFSGLASRVLQHEIDHLNGKLLIDYL